MKKCSLCKQSKNLDCFSNYSHTVNKKQSYCKTCQAIKQKAYYLKYRKKLIKDRSKWRHSSEENKNKDKVSYYRWKKSHPEAYKKSWKDYNHRRREKVLRCISTELKCVRCGCDMFEILEINHKNGGGHKETKYKINEFHRKILSGERKTNDLEILCKPCNVIHYIELKYGVVPYEIIWQGLNND
jgi:hypothetical protein